MLGAQPMSRFQKVMVEIRLHLAGLRSYHALSQEARRILYEHRDVLMKKMWPVVRKRCRRNFH